MNSFARLLADAQQAVAGIDTRDISSLAYVSSLVALETVIPGGSAAEMEFTISVHSDGTLSIDLEEIEVDEETRATINLVASHYFQAQHDNIPVSVH